MAHIQLLLNLNNDGGQNLDKIKKIGLNSNQIKVIAIIAMTIDHVTWLLFPGCSIIAKEEAGKV